MSDRRWVVRECLSRAATDYDAQLKLLKYGLRETAKHACLPGGGPRPKAAAATPGGATPGTSRTPGFSPVAGLRTPMGTPGGFTPATPGGEGAAAADWVVDSAEARWYRWQRLQLFSHADRLETLQQLTKRDYDANAYQAFRSEPLLTAATALAVTGAVAPLGLLLQRHPAALQPHLLQLLSALPEVVGPRTLSQLLPKGGSSTTGTTGSSTVPLPVNPRKPDWVECEAVVEELLGVASKEHGFDRASGRLPNDAAVDPGTPSGAPFTASAAAAAAAAVPEEGFLGTPTAGTPRTPVAAVVRAQGLGRLGSWDASELSAEEAGELLGATETIVRLAGEGAPPAEEQVLQWYYSRALQVDEATGQLGLSLALLEQAAARGLLQPGQGVSPAVAAGRQRLQQLMLMAKVLQVVVGSWWPVGSSSSSSPNSKQQQHEKGEEAEHEGQQEGPDNGSLVGAASPRGKRASLEQPAPSRAMFLSYSDDGDDATADAVVTGYSSSWSYSLSVFVSLGLLGQLQVALAGREANILEEDVQTRLLPLLSCYSPEEQGVALQQLLVEKVASSSSSSGSGGNSKQSARDAAAAASEPGAAAGWHKSVLQKVVDVGSSSIGQGPGISSSSGSSSGSMSAGWAWVVALVEREVGAAKRKSTQQQQLQQQQRPGQGMQAPRSGVPAADGGEVVALQPVWVDPAAMGTAVKAVVISCTSTNQWAKVRTSKCCVF